MSTQSRVNFCAIGRPKTGKTYSLNTLPGRTVLLSSDVGGWHAIRSEKTFVAPGSLAATPDLATFVVVDYTQHFNSIADSMDRIPRATKERQAYASLIKDANNLLTRTDVDNVAMDSLTGFSEMILGAALAINMSQKPNLMRDYGAAINKVFEIVSVLCGGPFNFVLTSHIRVDKDEDTGKLQEAPLIYGRDLPDKLTSLFDTVFKTGSANGVYWWETKPQPLLQCIGSRLYDGLPARIAQDFGGFFSGQHTEVKSAAPSIKQ